MPVLAFSLFYGGCQANRQIMNSAPAASPTPFATAVTRQNSVEQEIRDMETVGFKYVFVLRRRDGGVWDAEDRKYLRQNTPPETNRFVSVDGDKAFVIGSAYRLAPEDIEALKRRFDLEDVSKPEPKDANANQAASADQTNANAERPRNANSANGVNQSTVNK